MKKHTLIFLILSGGFVYQNKSCAQQNAFSYGYSSHTMQLTSVDKELISISGKTFASSDFKNVYADIKGNAFLLADWTGCYLYNNKGDKYINLKAQLDLYKNKLYLDFHDTIFNASEGIIRVELYPNLPDSSKKIIISKEFSLPAPATGKYAEVLSQGKTSFVKYTSKEVQEIQTDIYASKEKVFNEKIYYYVVSKTGQALEIPKLNKKNLQKAVADKWSDVEKFVNSNSELSYSNENDWEKIIDFYNALN